VELRLGGRVAFGRDIMTAPLKAFIEMLPRPCQAAIAAA